MNEWMFNDTPARKNRSAIECQKKVNEWNERMFNDTPARKPDRLLGVKKVNAQNEWMNECLTTPQHEKQIGYWVSEKGKRTKWMNEWMFNDTPARKTDWILGVRKR